MKKAFVMVGLLVQIGFPMPAVAQDVAIPDPGLNAAIRDTLGKPSGPLTAEDLLSLTNLNILICVKGADQCSFVENLEGLGAAHNLTSLSIGVGGYRGPENLVVPTGLTSLTTLGLVNILLTNVTLPEGLTNLTTLDLSGNRLTDFSFMSGLPSLTTLNLADNQLTTLTLPAGLTNLTTLELAANRLIDDFSFLTGLISLTRLNVYNNGLTTLTLPEGLTNLSVLDLSYNQLTSLSLPAGLTGLTTLHLYNNQLTAINLPAGLPSLTTLELDRNRITNVTLPPELTSLSHLSLEANPLMTLVLPESTPTSYLAVLAETFRNGGVSVYTYPLVVSFVNGRRTTAGAFEFTLTGPPGGYTVLSPTGLHIWSDLGMLTNQFGTVIFTDPQTIVPPQKFYQVRSAP